MKNRSYRGLLWSLALIGATLDLTSKYAVFRWLAHDTGERDLFPGKFKLIAQFTDKAIESGWREPLQSLNGPMLPFVNTGALFGMGRDYGYSANGFFAVVSLIAAVAILTWSFRAASARDGVLCAALGLILGGTFGNLFDRIVFHGVRDFLDFYLIQWPVFNVADCCLVTGAGMLLLQALWPVRTENGEPVQTQELAGSAKG